MKTNASANVAIALLINLLSSSAFQPCSTRFDSVSLPQSKSKSTRRKSLTTKLYSILEEIESQATAAAETWSVEATPFLEPDIASQVEQRFQDRGDVTAFRVVGGRRSPADSDKVSKGEGRRSRFVICHADLGMDLGTAESEFCKVIRVENVNIGASNTFPNALASIGVDLDYVGDVVKEDSSTMYVVINPEVEKQCLRLLSKELVGVGISVEVMESNEFLPDGEIQEMKLSRLLERERNRKKLEKGYVQFS